MKMIEVQVLVQEKLFNETLPWLSRRAWGCAKSGFSGS